MAQYQLVTCTINGKKSEKMVDVRASLTDMLRNDYRLTSVKKGCEVGECGACTALINGEAINTCLYLAVWAEGKDIVTLEGLMNPDGTLSDVQKAFMEETSIQCGFCIPGFILTATEIVNSGKEYTSCASSSPAISAAARVIRTSSAPSRRPCSAASEKMRKRTPSDDR